MKASLLTIFGLSVAVSFTSMAAGTNDMRGQLGHADYKFAGVANKAGMEEISLSQIALAKASDANVKSFAQKMVDDHTKAASQLSKVVADKGATLSTAPDKTLNKETTRLQGLSGAEFDKAYMGIMLNDHKMAVKEFEYESNHAKDEDLKAFAASTLPTLQDHLKMAEDLNGKVSGTAKP